MSADSPSPSYTLEQLAEGSGIYERTIRSYIARGLLPPPDGRGRAASYGPEHLTRLKFIQAVREAALPYELPLAKIEELLRVLPAEQIERVASGEEKVQAAFVGELDPALMRRRRSERDEQWERPVRRAPPQDAEPLRSYAPPQGSFRPPEPLHDESVWTSIDVTQDLRLSMRGGDEATRMQLDHLAARLRRWMRGGPPE